MTFFLIIILVISILSCEKDNEITKPAQEVFLEIGDSEYYSDNQGNCWNGSDHWSYPNPEFSAYGISFYDLGDGISISMYWATVHDITDQYLERSCNGHYYFIEDTSFHNLFYLGDNNFYYETPNPVNTNIIGTKGVYIELNMNGKIYLSYKVENDMYITNSLHNQFTLTNMEVLNYSYEFISISPYQTDECSIDNIRSYQLGGEFNCMLYHHDYATNSVDSIYIKNCIFSGTLKEG